MNKPNFTNKENPTTGSRDEFVRTRQIKRQAIKQTDDEHIKNKLRQEILQNQIDEEEQDLNNKQQKIQQIKEQYYQTIEDMTDLYKQMNLVKSARQMGERYNKSSCYFLSSKKNNNLPSLQTLNQLSEDLMFLVENFDNFSRFLKKATIKQQLKNLLRTMIFLGKCIREIKQGGQK